MYNEKEARELVIEAGHKLVEKKLIARTWGNISARISATEFVITPSGRGYDTLTPEDLVVVKIKDCSYEGDIKPSSEKKIHAAAYAYRKDCNFVIHTHQFFASALAANGRDLDFAPCASYALPGTDKLRNNVAKSIAHNPESKSFLLEKHGTLLLGDSYEQAFELAEELEVNSKKEFDLRVPSMDVYDLDSCNISSVIDENDEYAVLVQDPYVMECCYSGQTLMPYIDDFAQLIGPDARLCPNSSLKIKLGLICRNAVLVRDVGAICTGRTREDAEAAAMIISKNCAAVCYARNTKPLSIADANMQRYIYLKKYSKLK
ncbi:MAG: class II aldolase/adducin family protein [Clostridiales bacterium]|nr:class II aldolase/adducin family protein [Candidatus Crickella caballi]